VDRAEAGVATGRNGAVTVAYNGIAARAGLEALKQGGGANDAAMTAAVTQVAVTAGAPISYFGVSDHQTLNFSHLLFLTGLSRRERVGRPPVNAQVRAFIRQLTDRVIFNIFFSRALPVSVTYFA